MQISIKLQISFNSRLATLKSHAFIWLVVVNICDIEANVFLMESDAGHG